MAARKPTRPKKLASVTIQLPPKAHKRLQEMAKITGKQPVEIVVEMIDERFKAAKIPNARTRKAIEDARKGKNLKSFKTVEQLFDDLNS